MLNARGKNERSVRDADTPNSSRVSTFELSDFMKEQALRRPIKEVARLTGLSTKAVEHIRDGTAAANGQTISTWCRNDPKFRAEYFYWCGGYLENDPEFVAGMSRLLNDYARRLHRESRP